MIDWLGRRVGRTRLYGVDLLGFALAALASVLVVLAFAGGGH